MFENPFFDLFLSDMIAWYNLFCYEFFAENSKINVDLNKRVSLLQNDYQIDDLV